MLSRFTCLFLILTLLPVTLQAQQVSSQILRIAEPFIEMHSGPGSVYPVFHVIDRGEEIVVIRQKTDWYRIRSAQGKEGWVNRDQLQKTLLRNGQRLQLTEITADDFRDRQWAMGVSTGEFADAPILSLHGGYAFNQNLSAELTFGHSVGNVSSSDLIKINLSMQAFPQWDYSPFFTLGAGRIKVTPSATLIEPIDKENNFTQMGLGIKKFLAKRFVLRAEINEYVILSTTNDKDENEDISEWKLGFEIFF